MNKKQYIAPTIAVYDVVAEYLMQENNGPITGSGRATFDEPEDAGDLTDGSSNTDIPNGYFNH